MSLRDRVSKLEGGPQVPPPLILDGDQDPREALAAARRNFPDATRFRPIVVGMDLEAATYEEALKLLEKARTNSPWTPITILKSDDPSEVWIDDVPELPAEVKAYCE